jgi:hypothetical protein
MSRMVFIFVVTFGVLLALGINAWGIVTLAAVSLLLFAALYGMCCGKLPRNFLLAFGSIIFGPVLLCCLLKSWLGNLPGSSGPVAHLIMALVAITASLASFVYVRSRLRHSRVADRRQLHTNERQPIAPVDIEEEAD